MTDTAKLTHQGSDLELPVVPAVEGNNGLDISSLLKTTGDVTLDVGFVNTASCKSEITYIDGGEGILRYRGYPIEQLAEKSNFLRPATCSSTASCRPPPSWRSSTSGCAGILSWSRT